MYGKEYNINNEISYVAKVFSMSEQDVINNSKKLEDLNSNMYWQPFRGGVTMIIDENGDALCVTSSVNPEKLIEKFRTGERRFNIKEYYDCGKKLGGENVDDKPYSKIINKNDKELKKIIQDKKILLKEKINDNINDLEKSNDGYLFWDCKMIIRNIYDTMNFLIRNYGNILSEMELIEYKRVSEILENIDKEKKIKDMEDIKTIYNNYLI